MKPILESSSNNMDKYHHLLEVGGYFTKLKVITSHELRSVEDETRNKFILLQTFHEDALFYT